MLREIPEKENLEKIGRKKGKSLYIDARGLFYFEEKGRMLPSSKEKAFSFIKKNDRENLAYRLVLACSNADEFGYMDNVYETLSATFKDVEEVIVDEERYNRDLPNKSMMFKVTWGMWGDKDFHLDIYISLSSRERAKMILTITSSFAIEFSSIERAEKFRERVREFLERKDILFQKINIEKTTVFLKIYENKASPFIEDVRPRIYGKVVDIADTFWIYRKIIKKFAYEIEKDEEERMIISDGTFIIKKEKVFSIDEDDRDEGKS